MDLKFATKLRIRILRLSVQWGTKGVWWGSFDVKTTMLSRATCCISSGNKLSFHVACYEGLPNWDRFRRLNRQNVERKVWKEEQNIHKGSGTFEQLLKINSWWISREWRRCKHRVFSRSCVEKVWERLHTECTVQPKQHGGGNPSNLTQGDLQLIETWKKASRLHLREKFMMFRAQILESFLIELWFPRFCARCAGTCCPVWNTREFKKSAPLLRRDLP